MDSAGRGERSQQEMKDSDERAHVHAPAPAPCYMHACSRSLQALVLFISTRGALAATHSTAHMALPERRYKTEDGGGGSRRKGDAGNMQKRGGQAGCSWGGGEERRREPQMEVRERKQRAWLILHQTCPLSFSVCPPSSPTPPHPPSPPPRYI